MFSMSYGGDEFYVSAAFEQKPDVARVVPPINGVAIAGQLVVGKRRLTSLYVYNRSGSEIYLGVFDSADGGVTLGARGKRPYPITSDNFISLAFHGGWRFENGIYVAGFTDNALSTPSGADLWFDGAWVSYH